MAAACINLGGNWNIAANASFSFVVAFGGYPQQDAGTLVFMATPKNNGILEVTHQAKQRFGNPPGLIQYQVTVQNKSNNAVQFGVQAGIVCQ